MPRVRLDVLGAPRVCSKPTRKYPSRLSRLRYAATPKIGHSSRRSHFSAVTLTDVKSLCFATPRSASTSRSAPRTSHVRAKPARLGIFSTSDATTTKPGAPSRAAADDDADESPSPNALFFSSRLILFRRRTRRFRGYSRRRQCDVPRRLRRETDRMKCSTETETEAEARRRQPSFAKNPTRRLSSSFSIRRRRRRGVVVADDAGYLFARVVAAAHGIPPQRRLCALALERISTRALCRKASTRSIADTGAPSKATPVGFGFGFGFGSGRLRRRSRGSMSRRAPKQRAR